MRLFKTLKGQVLLISVACVAVGLATLTAANYLASRSQAYESLAAQSAALARSHAESLRDWVRAKEGIVAASAAAVGDADPVPALRMLQNAGSYLTTYFGYADKHTAFSAPRWSRSSITSARSFGPPASSFSATRSARGG